MLSEQEERRRRRELLHDGPVQQSSAISQMLDAGLADLEGGDVRARDGGLRAGLELARDAARDLRQLWRRPRAARAPRARLRVRCRRARPAGSSRHDVEIDLDVAHRRRARRERRRRLYQILREATEQAVQARDRSRASRSPSRPTRTGGGIESHRRRRRSAGAPRSGARARSPSARGDAATADSARRSAIRVG